MKSRWKHDKPMSRTDFDSRFPDDAACARHLAQLRWPDGFVCPARGACKGWKLETKRFTWECSGCHRRTSVTAGTVMHRSKVRLRTWFEAVHLMTSHSNGISAEQAQAHLRLGSYKTAWLLLHKLRRAMVNPERSLLQGLVEVDETEVPLRSRHDPIAGYGIPNVGKMPKKHFEVAAQAGVALIVQSLPPPPRQGMITCNVERGIVREVKMKRRVKRVT
jgi:hypothetical protein